ncbi:MAG: acyl-CoA thioesterase [Lachnospiraceae bacterium]|jgi:acyl-CoA hydrolase|nr:acyl-CoA thioesterase [Lachnospiraceae bacterium]
MEENKREERPVSYSATESTHVLKYEDINGQGRLFGGRLMAWIDETGGMAAMRHSGCHVTTAAVDNLQFKRGARLNDTVVLAARVTYVGNTSMEVRVDSYLEENDGRRYPINRAFLIYVAVDENGDPVRVPYLLKIESESEKADWEGAMLRKENRRIRRQEGF